MYLHEHCPQCGGNLALMSTTNQWDRYCKACDQRYNKNGEPMPVPAQPRIVVKDQNEEV